MWWNSIEVISECFRISQLQFFISIRIRFGESQTYEQLFKFLKRLPLIISYAVFLLLLQRILFSFCENKKIKIHSYNHKCNGINTGVIIVFFVWTCQLNFALFFLWTYFNVQSDLNDGLRWRCNQLWNVWKMNCLKKTLTTFRTVRITFHRFI